MEKLYLFKSGDSMKYAIFFSILFLITACTQAGQYKNVDIYTGTQGLDIDYELNAPSNEIYENETFNIDLEGFNRATFNINNLQIYIYGLHDEYFKQIEPLTLKSNSPIKAKDQYNLNGDYVFISGKYKNLGIPPNYKEYIQPLVIETCYEGKTTAPLPICINPFKDSENRLIEDPCKIQPEQSFSGQGAPVAVSNLKQTLLSNPKQMKFEIQIKNVDHGKISDCKSSKKWVKLSKVSFGNYKYPQDIKCEPTELELPSQDKFICYANIKKSDLNNIYPTQLLVDFTYNYKHTYEKELKVLKR